MLVSIMAAGCGPAEDEGDARRKDEAPESWVVTQPRASGAGKVSRALSPKVADERAPVAALKPRSAPDALAWTRGGELAIIDGDTGAVRSSRIGAGLGGARDLVFDPWGNRALVFEGDAVDDWGEIAKVPILSGPTGPTLGPRAQVTYVDGEARLLASPLGMVVFEVGAAGERCKVLFDAGGPSASVAWSAPASAWVEAGGAIAVHALHYGDDADLVRRTAPLKWMSLGAPAATPLDLTAEGALPTARLVRAPARGGAILLDIEGSALSLRLVSGASVGAAANAPLGAAKLRIEHAIAIDGGEVVLALLSGQSRVVAVTTDAAGAIVGVDTVLLPGLVREEFAFFSHDLAKIGERRALAATSAGVFAIQIVRDATGAHLALDPSFVGGDLSGPVAAIDSSEP